MNTPWVPPEPPATQAEGEVIATDPRVVTAHVAGQLPCPANPPPPVGWQYWRGKVTPFGVHWCQSILRIPSMYPMGSFVQVRDGDTLLAARVEWHTYQGSTGKRGCFRGVNLMSKP